MELSPGTVIGGYRLVRELGSGGMGAVFLARHPSLPRDVAIKVLHPALARTAGLRARFEREAELLCRLSHPGVVDVLDRGQDGDHLWMTMPYVQGEDLAARLARHRGLPAADVVRIGAAVADALDHAHSRGLLHRDVKPANILLAPQPDGSERVFLTDFGIARALEPTEALTRAGEVVATIAYASPEQVSGTEIDQRADVYSLAAVLFELLTGRPVFEADRAVSLLWAVVNRPAPDIRSLRPDLHPRVSAVFARALAKDPAFRQGSCRELVGELQAALGQPQRAPETVIWPERGRERDVDQGTGTRGPGRGWIWGLVGAGAALLALVIVLVVTLGGPDEPASVPGAQVADRVEELLLEQHGITADVRCPEDLPAVVGAQIRCVVREQGVDEDYGATVTAGAVDDGTVTFLEYVVDDEPLS